MKTTLLTAFIMLSLLTTVAGQNTIKSDGILGNWLSEKKDGKIEIFKQGGKYYGKLVWGKTMFEPDGLTSKKDVNNPQETLRSRSLKDLIILSDFIYQEEVWSDGKIYDPQAGKIYRCTMKLEKNVLSIRGFIGFSLFGRTTEWTKIK